MTACAGDWGNSEGKCVVQVAKTSGLVENKWQTVRSVRQRFADQDAMVEAGGIFAMRTRVMEVWSPLKWIGIRFYVADEGQWYVQLGTRSRRRM
ncbi:MAG: hypothetical protein ACYCYO_11385 [Bacilli bacterium]